MNGVFAIFSVQALYGLLVLICVVAGAHLVKLKMAEYLPMVFSTEISVHLVQGCYNIL
jgi:hypothetical protein